MYRSRAVFGACAHARALTRAGRAAARVSLVPSLGVNACERNLPEPRNAIIYGRGSSGGLVPEYEYSGEFCNCEPRARDHFLDATDDVRRQESLVSCDFRLVRCEIRALN